MNIDIFTSSSADDASDYTFNNLYFHPDFFSTSSDPILRQVFSSKSSATNDANDEDADAINGKQGESDET